MNIKTNNLFNNKLDLKDYEIKKDTYKYYNIDTIVLSFFNGRNWNIISLDTMLKFPIMYFNYWSDKHQKTFINTLLVCPITMRSIIYKGKIEIIDLHNDNLLLFSKLTNDKFYIDKPYTGHKDESGKEKKIKSHIKRHEVKISTLKRIFIFATDVVFLKAKLKSDYIISKEYYTNRLMYDDQPLRNYYHPKSLVYVIQYYSHNYKQYKYIILIGKDIDQLHITGYDINKSKIWSYLSKNKEKYIKKKAYIYPMFWFMAEKLHRDADKIMIR